MTTPTPEDGATHTERACIFCRNNDMSDVCWHSPEYEPVARALAEAFNGANPTDEQVGWYVDEAEDIAGDLRFYLGRETPLTARDLGALERDLNLHAVVFNERLIVMLEGSNDGSGEVYCRIVADLDSPYRRDGTS